MKARLRKLGLTKRRWTGGEIKSLPRPAVPSPSRPNLSGYIWTTLVVGWICFRLAPPKPGQAFQWLVDFSNICSLIGSSFVLHYVGTQPRFRLFLVLSATITFISYCALQPKPADLFAFLVGVAQILSWVANCFSLLPAQSK